MFINCSGSLSCDGLPIAIVDSFKYLGVVIRQTRSSPSSLLFDKILATRKAFAALCSNARYLSVHNCRVRVHLVQSLAVSVLLGGCVVYACLSDMQLTTAPTKVVWRKVESLLHTMLRWALVAPRDTRTCFLHVVSNCPSVQALVWKRCSRYFRGVADHPRFITKFQQAIISHVDPVNMGLTSLRWWPEVCDAHKCADLSIPDIYHLYRQHVQMDLRKSTRIQSLGLSQVVADMLYYCFRAGLMSPPPGTHLLLCKLHRADHSIIWDKDEE